MNKPNLVGMNMVSTHLLRTSIAVISLAFLAAILGACASTPATQSMRDPAADFNSYKTFGWGTTTTGANEPAQPVSVVDSTIRAAIATQLKSKGYEEATGGAAPDLIIGYEAARADKIKSAPRIGIGIGGWGGNGGASVGASSSGMKNVKEGSLIVHAIDRARNAEVWTGNVARELDQGNVPPELVQDAVAELFHDFPAHTTAP